MKLFLALLLALCLLVAGMTVFVWSGVYKISAKVPHWGIPPWRPKWTSRAYIAGAMRLSGGSPRTVRRMFSAINFARASSIPSVQPDTCGVMRTFGSS